MDAPRPRAEKPQANYSLFEPRGSKRAADQLEKNGDDDKWGNFGNYMEAKKQKLAAQFADAANNITPTLGESSSNLFTGIAINVNGSTNPSSAELKRLMMLHGGSFHLYYSRKRTTHIIASILPYTKIVNLKYEKVTKPEWITDSIAAGRLLPWEDYQLYPQNNTRTTTSVKLLEDTKTPVVKPSEPLEEPRASTSKPSKNYGEPRAPTLISGELPVAHKAGDPNYLNQFYARSRLHHLSIWKTESKQLVRTLQEASDGRFSGRERLKQHFQTRSGNEKPTDGLVIMHIDFDCFFVSVGLLSRRHLVGKPVAVCHGRSGHGKQIAVNEDSEVGFNSRSEVASCSYAAREKGLKNGMYLGPAKQLCPELVTIPYEFERYKEISTCFYETVASYTLHIEAISCDEMIVDCTEVLKETNVTPLEFARFIRKEIFERSGGCTASAGLGPNPLLARLATKKAKPDGEYYVSKKDIPGIMSGVPVNDIPGAGHSAMEKFEKLGAKTCSDLQKVSLERIQKEFGPKKGQKFYEICRGIDQHLVQNQCERKSVSADVNYGIRLKTVEEFSSFFKEMATEIEQRLNLARVIGHTITLKLLVRHPDAPVDPPKYMGCGHCNSFTRSVSLIQATDCAEIIAKEGVAAFKKMDIDVKEIRGIGIQITRLLPKKTSIVKQLVGKEAEEQPAVKEFIMPLKSDVVINPEIQKRVYEHDDDSSSSDVPCGQRDRSRIEQDQDIDEFGSETQDESFAVRPFDPRAIFHEAEGVNNPAAQADNCNYNLVKDVGWGRVYRSLKTDLKVWINKAQQQKASELPEQLRRKQVLLRKLSQLVNLPSRDLDDSLVEHVHHAEHPQEGSHSSPMFPASDSLDEYEANLEESFSNILHSTLLGDLDAEFPLTQLEPSRIETFPPESNEPEPIAPETQLDEIGKTVFRNMCEEFECKFWLNYFNIPEDVSVVQLPLTMYGATLTYLDAPRVTRRKELGAKTAHSKVLWAMWQLNTSYTRKWLLSSLGNNGFEKAPQQKTLDLCQVTASQAEIQRGKDLKVRGGFELPRKAEKVQMMLHMGTLPEVKEEKPANDSLVSSLPNASQVDVDFLAAMPAEILDELYVIYGEKYKPGPSLEAKTTAKNKKVNIIKSKGKAQLNLKTAVRKSGLKSGQNKPEKLSISQKSMDGFLKVKKGKNTLSQESRKPKVVLPEREVICIADEMIDLSTPPIVVDGLRKDHRALLFGKTELADIREALENILPCLAPENELQEAIVAFAGNQLVCGRLSQVDLLMKFWHREIDYLKEKEQKRLWISAYRRVTERVQCLVTTTFGSALPMKSFH